MAQHFGVGNRWFGYVHLCFYFLHDCQSTPTRARLCGIHRQTRGSHLFLLCRVVFGYHLYPLYGIHLVLDFRSLHSATLWSPPRRRMGFGGRLYGVDFCNQYPCPQNCGQNSSIHTGYQTSTPRVDGHHRHDCGACKRHHGVQLWHDQHPPFGKAQFFCGTLGCTVCL